MSQDKDKGASRRLALLHKMQRRWYANREGGPPRSAKKDLDRLVVEGLAVFGRRQGGALGPHIKYNYYEITSKGRAFLESLKPPEKRNLLPPAKRRLAIRNV